VHATTEAGISSQEVYKKMMDGTISPKLRELGFQGSGGRYSLKSDEYWALLSFQKSAYSDSDQIRCTINLMVVSRQQWDAYRAEQPGHPARPAAGTGYSSEICGTRIGDLDPERLGDKWWKVQPSAGIDRVVADVLHHVEHWALPWMRTQMSL
jgi:hypothetical protein